MEPIGPDLWHVRGPDVKLPGGARLPLYATVARLADRTLAIYSPCAFDDAAAAAIEREGEVAHVIAPSLLHHLHVTAALGRWPRATLHAPAGLATKRPELPAARPLADPGPAWASSFDAVTLAGVPAMEETVLLHRASGTLVCADFVFNVTAPANLRTRILLALTGTGGRTLRQSRAWRFLARDKPALAGSVAHVLGWPIRQVAPVHGPATVIDPAGLKKLLRTT